MAISSALLNSTIRHQVYLERLKTGEVNQFAAFLRLIDADLRDRLTQQDITVFSRTRLERLLAAIERSLLGIYDNYYDELAGHLTDIAEYESKFEATQITRAVPTFEAVIPAPVLVREAIFSDPLSVKGADGGKLLEPFMRDWSNTEVKRVSNAIRQGVFEGQTNFQILQRIRGTKTNNYRDGVLAVSNRNASAVVRTSVQHVASSARFKTWEANTDIVTGYRWVSTLDGRTSTICRSLDGRVFKIGEGPRPPAHINCRSTTVAELDARYNFLKEGRTRASKDGPVDSELPYYEWLKRQPAEFQDDVLGPTRGKLLRDGGLTSKRFADLQLGRNFRPLTLDEMRRKEPLAFKRAFE